MSSQSADHNSDLFLKWRYEENSVNSEDYLEYGDNGFLIPCDFEAGNNPGSGEDSGPYFVNGHLGHNLEEKLCIFWFGIPVKNEANIF